MQSVPARRSFAIGLGANLGEPRPTFARAAERLKGHGRILAASSLYVTHAVGPPQPDYLNAAILLDTELEAEALLRVVLAVEAELGRTRRVRWGPRVLDLDLLWAEGAEIRTVALSLPHPELKHRAFALAPLLEVAPSALDPVTGEPYSACLARLGTAWGHRVEGTSQGRWIG
jgi:2-amino-4-hydroxy-6-hydroxymethyldihydropteridine diphosphokinase